MYTKYFHFRVKKYVVHSTYNLYKVRPNISSKIIIDFGVCNVTYCALKI